MKDQVAIITGAGRGLGRAIARCLAAHGVRVALCSRNENDLAAVCSEIELSGGKAMFQSVDVSRWSQVKLFTDAVLERMGCPHILINNAGLGWYKPFEEQSIEEIDTTLDVNLKGLIYMTRAILPHMLERKSGQILNIASDLGRRVIPNMATYVAAKHGVLGFSGSLVREVKDKGIKVMTLTPGIIDTWFGGREEGSGDETWAMKPQVVADMVFHMLTLPPFVMMDEVSVHPMHQEL